MGWELVTEEATPPDTSRMHRLAVPGGWLYRVTTVRAGFTSVAVVWVKRDRYDPTRPPNH